MRHWLKRQGNGVRGPERAGPGVPARSIATTTTIASMLAFSLLFLMRPPSAWACLGARQFRLIPLGTRGPRLVLLELRQLRFAGTMGRTAKPSYSWRVQAALRHADTRGRLLRARIVIAKNVVVHDHRYTTEIRPLVRLALQRARKRPGFREFGRPRLEICDWGLRCAGWRPVATRLGRLYFSRRRRGHPARLIEFTQLKRYLAWAMNSHDSGPNDTSGTDVAVARQIGFYWAVRHRWGRREIVVINLSHRYSGSPNEKGWTVQKCRSVQTCVPPEPDGGHQLGVDVLMVLDPRRPASVATRTALPRNPPSNSVGGAGARTP